MAKYNNRKRRLDIKEEFLEPAEKLVSDGDLLIKSLSQKQLKKTVSLNESLINPKVFLRTTELLPLANYSSGIRKLQEVKTHISYFETLESLKRANLSKDDMELLVAYNKFGIDYVEEKHKNINKTVLHDRINHLLKTVSKCNVHSTSGQTNIGKHKSELGLAVKPESIETKLLQFALQCSNAPVENTSTLDPINRIHEYAEKITENVNKPTIPTISKRRRKLRKNSHKLASNLGDNLPAPALTYSETQWDKKETNSLIKEYDNKKTYTCKSQKLYTIKDNCIVPIEIANKQCTVSSSDENVHKRLSIPEIKAMPKFASYEIGEASKVIYIKNVHYNTTEEEFGKLFQEYERKNIIESIKLMKGKMRGQAFISLLSKEDAVEVMNNLNGIVLHNKPIVMQYGKTSSI